MQKTKIKPKLAFPLYSTFPLSSSWNLHKAAFEICDDRISDGLSSYFQSWGKPPQGSLKVSVLSPIGVHLYQEKAIAKRIFAAATERQNSLHTIGKVGSRRTTKHATGE